jgi:hypothetical protein
MEHLAKYFDKFQDEEYDGIRNSLPPRRRSKNALHYVRFRLTGSVTGVLMADHTSKSSLPSVSSVRALSSFNPR